MRISSTTWDRVITACPRRSRYSDCESRIDVVGYAWREDRPRRKIRAVLRSGNACREAQSVQEKGCLMLLIAILLSVAIVIFTGYRGWSNYRPGVWQSPWGEFDRTRQPIHY